MNKILLCLTLSLAGLPVTVHAQPTDAALSPPIHDNLTTVQIYNQYREEYQNITYYVDDHGDAIYDNHIIWGPEELLLSWRVSGESSLRHKRWDAVKPKHGWPSFPIPYRYDSDTTRNTLRVDVEAALNDWMQKASFVRFVERQPNPALEQGVVVITSGFGPCSTNRAFVNNPFSIAKPRMNIHPRCHDPLVIKRFWGYQLGLADEHQRPDRNNWVKYHCDAVEPESLSSCAGVECCTNPYTLCCAGRTYTFKIRPASNDYQSESTYDFDSIMHTSGTTFARAGQYTLTKLNDTPCTENTEISPGDVRGLCAIYPQQCNAPTAPSCGKCNPTAGLNKCDITTSCITTGTGDNHYCSCRAGYKATTGTDPAKQFRLSMPGQEYRVFVPENTSCNELCDNPLSCSEVALQDTCPL